MCSDALLLTTSPTANVACAMSSAAVVYLRRALWRNRLCTLKMEQKRISPWAKIVGKEMQSLTEVTFDSLRFRALIFLGLFTDVTIVLSDLFWILPEQSSLLAYLADLQSNEPDVRFLKKYVSYGRMHCGSRFNPLACEKLASNYVRKKNPLVHSGDNRLSKKLSKSSISITVRQLEAAIRMRESLAKMELQPFAYDKQVDEALCFSVFPPI
ncbi:unnamed protein product [Heligmosomoides polygyrus]|uniref:MCM_lid domain-containing protein n=1 Tax=Heligmosomoides polygyrus TaxID=6339 RepID=A0A183GQI6_HELPZ|nr:unnamed protein product [Heligmosomoides polygyrus]